MNKSLIVYCMLVFIGGLFPGCVQDFCLQEGVAPSVIGTYEGWVIPDLIYGRMDLNGDGTGMFASCGLEDEEAPKNNPVVWRTEGSSISISQERVSSWSGQLWINRKGEKCFALNLTESSGPDGSVDYVLVRSENLARCRAMLGCIDCSRTGATNRPSQNAQSLRLP